MPSGPAWLARPTSTNLHALDGWPPRSAGTGARLSAHEIASTLTGHHPDGARPRRPCASRRAQFRSHSPPSGAVRRRTRTTFLPRSGTLATGGGWPSAVLESVRRGSRPGLMVLSQFLSHSPSSGAVHQRSPRSFPGRSRTVAATGERRSALLESVLVATAVPPGNRKVRRFATGTEFGWLRVVQACSARSPGLAGGVSHAGSRRAPDR
jgi:hypothetical protein